MVPDPTREVRFAVVLYGGVSLAIYMNGVAQELLRMVRGSSGLPDAALDDAERVYRDLSAELAGPAGGRTRFAIDIISGTSAGGINGVALAKALVRGCPDLKALRRAWTEEADISQLLNDRGVFPGRGRTASLLDGAHMYDLLLRTLGAMETDAGTPLTETLDLFVTATDLQGRATPIQLTGESLDERVHKAVFRFGFDAGEAERNDFTAVDDPMLAFAARATSSFPVAFPPVCFDDLPAAVQGDRGRFARFFAGLGAGFGARQFADGGYLDNRPFSHAIDLIPSRPTSLPGERKLLFIDPLPEVATAEPEAAREIDFLQNTRLAASTLPRREVIRDDIRAVTAINRRLERLGTLQQRWQKDQAALRDLIHPPPEKPENLDSLDLADLVARGYGPQYPLYHHLRVYGTTDTLSRLVARLAGYDPQSDESAYLRQVIRGWRDTNFAAYATVGLRTENAFLGGFDIDFRLRRLSHLRAEIDTRLQAQAGEAPELWTLRRLVESELAAFRRRAASGPAKRLLDPAEVATLTGYLGPRYARVMAMSTLAQRARASRAIYRAPSVRGLVDKAFAAVEADFGAAFDRSSAAIRTALAAPEFDALRLSYDGFHWHDVLTFPFLEGTTAEEYGEVQVFRISPADSSLNPSPAKLAGVAAGAFGGFLSPDWREHDILWGRLDGAERIVTALLPDRRDEARRAAFVARLQEAVLQDEFGPEAGRGRRLALLKAKLRDRDVGDEALEPIAAAALGVTDAPALDRPRFAGHYAAVKPVGPTPRQVAGWSSRAAAILARMIDDLPPTGAIGIAGPRLSGWLRASGVLTARLARFALPGSFPRLQADWLLLVLILAGAVVVLVGLVTPSVQGVGAAMLAGALALWVTLYAAGRVLRGQVALPAAARATATAAVLLLALLGAWNLLVDTLRDGGGEAQAPRRVEAQR